MDLHRLEHALLYRFREPELLAQALTHKSWAVEHAEASQDNERLEFLGDAVLELVTSDLLFREYADRHSEGDMTRMRASLVNESQLAALARRLDLGSYMRLGRGEQKSGGSSKPSLLSDTLEAIFGAVYLDGGFQEAFSVIEAMFSDLIATAPRALRQDYKSRLQELVQAKSHEVPSYCVEDVSGPDHSREYHVSLSVDGKIISHGKGRSKKEAEQQAARRALEKLEQVKE